MYSFNSKKIFYYSLILFLINYSFQLDFECETDLNQTDLEPMEITFSEFTCPLIPSLFTPIILLPNGYSFNGFSDNSEQTSIDPNILFDEKFNGRLYIEVENNYFLSIGNTGLKYNYFGLSYEFLNALSLNEQPELTRTDVNNLNELKKKNITQQRIFSFDKWEELKDNSKIISNLHYGYNHDNFTSKEGIIGTCNILVNDSFWGCSFNNIFFNNHTISLINETYNYSQIYISSEDYQIKFPKIFQQQFIEAFDYKCNYSVIEEGSTNKIFLCEEFFEKKDFVEIKLNNSDMNITIEIDNLIRFTNISKENEKNKETRIKFHDKFNNIVLPLIMFKKFHVQFNREDNTINFFTTNAEILQLAKKKEKKKEDSSSSSAGLTVFLVILIIILVLALAFGLFYFIKKKYKSNVEKDINQFNKFEDEEDAKPMNDKKVY